MGFDSVISKSNNKKKSRLLKYRIVLESHYDEYGKETSHYYYIRVLKKFWFFKRWVTITHLDCGWGDCMKTVTKFNHKLDAAEYIDNVLRTQKRCDGWIEEIIREGNL